MKIILHWLVLSVAAWAASYFIAGITLYPLYVAIIVGAFLTLIHYVIKPIINILTLPINLITFGLFSLIVNGLLFWLLGTFIQGFHVATFVAAFWGALLVSVVNWILARVMHLD